jgi:hypothetical protein
MPKLKGHPIALEYPRASADDVEMIEADMKANGFDPRFKIVVYQGMILDGITRDSCAHRAGIEAMYEPFVGTEVEAKAFVERANENRRHLNVKWLRERRRDRVRAARAEGKSTRQIAGDEGVAQRTILNDLEVSGDDPASGEFPDRIIGADGKEYDAKKPVPKHLQGDEYEPPRCPNCEHRISLGRPVVNGCEECRLLQGKRPKGTPKPPKSGEEKFNFADHFAALNKLRRALDRVYVVNGLVRRDGAVQRDARYDTISRQLESYQTSLESLWLELTKQPFPKQ